MESSNTERIIVLVDMDCFYVQVEQKLCPEYLNKPCAVVQYKDWKGGGIIAVNYEARAKGVTRFLRGDEAQKVCPDIHLFRVPEIRGKADLTRYRDAGASVLEVLCEYSDCVERASIDEAYLDLTSVINAKFTNSPRVTAQQLQNTFVIGWEGEDSESRKEELEKWLQFIYEEEHLHHDRMLALAAVMVEEMRTAVYEKTGYRCSAGIAHNKMLSKLSCGLHKPNKQTVLPQASIQLLFKTIPIKKVRNLGGKLGEMIVKKFNAEKMGDLIEVPKSQFVNQFGEKTGNWLYNLIRGIDNEPVTSRQLPKSIGCGKNFPGKQSLSTKKDVNHWLKQLASELEERLIKDQNDNRRFARLLTVSLRTNENGVFSVVSRSCPIHVYNADKLAYDALAAINKLNTSSSSDIFWKPSIWTLSMAASKFEDRLDTSHCNIESYFTKGNSTLKDLSSNAGCSNADKTPDLSRKFLKSTKNEASDRSIISFFNKKKDIKIKVDEAETVSISKESYEENKELDSFLSACNDVNSNESNDSVVSKASVDKESITSEDVQDKLNGSVENKGDNVCDSDKSCVVKTHQICSVDKEFETVSPENHDKPLGFFTKKLEQQPKFSFELEFENCESLNDKSGDIKTNVSYVSGSDKASSPDKQDKPLGFFARKLKEKSKSNFNFDSETSCDSLNNEPEKSMQKNSNVSSSFPVQEEISNVSENNETYVNLDPELTKLCEQCNQRIPVWEEIEHLDYHLALNMSKEFTNNQRTSNNVSNIGKNVTQKSKGGRKRGSVTKPSSQSKRPVVQSKTLDAFFK